MIPLDGDTGRRWLARGGLVFAGALAGFFLRGGVSGVQQPSLAREAQSSVTPAVTASGSPASPHSSSRDDVAPERDPLAAFEATLPGPTKRLGIQGVLALYKAVEQLPPELIPEAMARARDLRDGDWLSVVSVVGSRWAMFDPVAAVKHVMSMRAPNDTVRKAALQPILERWAEDAPDAALAWINSSAPIQARSEFLSVLASTIGRTDPQRAIALVQQAPGSYQQSRQLSVLYGEWAAQDPQAAAAAAQALPGSMARTAAIGQIAGAWAKADPINALAWATSIHESGARDNAIGQAVTQWASTEPSAVLTWLGNVTDVGLKRQLLGGVFWQWVNIDATAAREHALTLAPGEREGAIEAVARGIAAQDPTKAMELIQQLPSARQGEAGRIVVMSLADRDPPAAAQLLLSLPITVGSDQAIHDVAHNWAQIDPAASADWVLQLAPDKRNGLSSLVRMWAQSDPSAAAAWYARNEFGSEGRFIAQNLAEELAANDEVAALRWAEKLGDEPRQSALGAIAARIATRDPLRAVQLVPQLPIAAQASASMRIVGAWARKDPAAAARWAITLPESIRSDALRNVVGSWVQEDAIGAVGWIQTLPTGQERDGVVGNFANEIIRSDPEGALTWAATISNETQRKNQLRNLASQWMRQDSANARRWVEGYAGFSAETKAEVLKWQ